MRDIDFIVLHCTATQPTATVAGILRYWRAELGWQNPGYHYLVAADGTVHHLQPLAQVANGVKGLNHRAVHLSYIGGIDPQGRPADTRTPAQHEALRGVLETLLHELPQAQVAGHYHFANKACPSFDVPRWLRRIGVPEGRIYDNGREAPVR